MRPDSEETHLGVIRVEVTANIYEWWDYKGEWIVLWEKMGKKRNKF